MKRLALYVAGMAVAAAAFAAGQATKLKFPWAGDALNRPCGKTELEWRCATAGIRADPPVTNGELWVVNSIAAEPRPKGLVLRRDVSPQNGVILRRGMPGWRGALGSGCRRGLSLAQARFGTGPGKGRAYDRWAHLAVYLSVDGAPSMVGVGGAFQEVTRFPK